MDAEFNGDLALHLHQMEQHVLADFTKVDEDASGFISALALDYLLSSLGLRSSEVKTVLEEVGSHGDHGVKYEDFVTWCFHKPFDKDDNGSDCSLDEHCIEVEDEPSEFISLRRDGVSAEAVGAFNQSFHSDVKPFYPKSKEQSQVAFQAFKAFPFLRNVQKNGIIAVCNALEIESYDPGDAVYQVGEFGNSGFVVLSGSAVTPQRRRRSSCQLSGRIQKVPLQKGSFQVGSFFGMSTMLWGTPREEAVYVEGEEELIVGKLEREPFFNLVTIHEMEKRTKMQVLIRKIRWLDFLNDEDICRLTDVLERREVPEGSLVYAQGSPSDEIYLLWSGRCAERRIRSDGTVDIVAEYDTEECFGENCFLGEVTRPHEVVPTNNVVKVLVLRKKVFERLFGNFQTLKKDSLLHDPRTHIADWCASISAFMVCRPTSRDAIAKMIDKSAVGKGLNIKGKSAKLNVLSGYVPFLQISNNDHKEAVEPSPPGSRVTVYFKSRWARELAYQHLLEHMKSQLDDSCLEVSHPGELNLDDSYSTVCPKAPARQVYGIELPEALLREVYIMKPDLGFRVGWDTGRPSEPVYMNMNLHSVRSNVPPKTVIYQFDQLDPLNPQGLLLAYAEDYVLPIVSDFDMFTIGTRGRQCERLDQGQLNIVMRMLDSVEMILQSPGNCDIRWNSRWLEVLQKWKEEGYYPEMPQYGFGDPRFLSLVESIADHTRACGAVRHGPECFNIAFPQEFDAEYLIVWDEMSDGDGLGGTGDRWKYVDEPGLRRFLMHRLSDGFCFPLNPAWPCLHQGWYDLYARMRSIAGDALDAWFPPESGILERVERIHKCFPDGFINEKDSYISERRTWASEAPTDASPEFISRRDTMELSLDLVEGLQPIKTLVSNNGC